MPHVALTQIFTVFRYWKYNFSSMPSKLFTFQCKGMSRFLLCEMILYCFTWVYHTLHNIPQQGLMNKSLIHWSLCHHTFRLHSWQPAYPGSRTDGCLGFKLHVRSLSWYQNAGYFTRNWFLIGYRTIQIPSSYILTFKLAFASEKAWQPSWRLLARA